MTPPLTHGRPNAEPEAAARGRITVTSSVDDDTNAWNILGTDRSYYVSADWMRLMESDTSVESEYVLVSDLSGRPVCGLPIYRTDIENNENYTPARLVGGDPDGAFQIAGSRRGYVNELLFDPAVSAAVRDDAIARAWSTAKELGAENGCRRTLMPFLTSASARLLGDAEGGVLPLLAGLDCAIDLPGETFDDYLDALPPKRASVVRREREAFHNAPYTLGVDELAVRWSECAPLLRQLQQRYGHADTIEQCRTYLRDLARATTGGIVFTCRLERRLVGFALFFTHSGVLYGRAAGFDYGRLCDAFEYFNLVYYLPICYAYQHGIRRVHLGRSSYDAKRRRGATLSPTWTVSSEHADHRAARARNSAALAEQVTDSARRTLAIPPGWTA